MDFGRGGGETLSLKGGWIKISTGISYFLGKSKTKPHMKFQITNLVLDLFATPSVFF
jgi:hypothetical protein